MRIVKISDVFEIKYGNSFELVNLIECKKTDSNCVNFISRTEKNNGVSAYVEKILDIEPNPSRTITVAVGGSVLSTFFQIQPYYTGFHVLVLSPKRKMSDAEMLFYAYVVRKNKYRYNYGRQANKTLKDILIPEKMPKEWSKIIIKNLNNLKQKPLKTTKLELVFSNWKNFNLAELFEIKGSKTTSLIELEDYGSGNFPYVTTQATNNGVEASFNNFTEEGNVLTIDSAVLGHCTYQPYNFSASDHVEKLIPKFKINKYLALFLTTIINKEKYRYNYGRKCSQDRMKQRSIKLPTKNNQPDWSFMEDYIRSLPYSASI